MIMQARVKAGWITEADLAPAKPRRPRKSPKPTPEATAESVRCPARRTYLCWRVPTTRARCRTAAGAGARAALHRHARGQAASTELIRFVVGAGRRGRPRPQAQAAGTRRLGHGQPGGGRRGGCARPSRAASSARSACRRTSRTLTEQLLERAALDALAIAGKAGPGRRRLRQGRGGARTRPGGGAGACGRCEPGRGPQARAALRRRYAPERPGRYRSICFSSAQLDLALGRSNVVHAALLAGPA